MMLLISAYQLRPNLGYTNCLYLEIFRLFIYFSEYLTFLSVDVGLAVLHKNVNSQI